MFLFRLSVLKLILLILLSPLDAFVTDKVLPVWPVFFAFKVCVLSDQNYEACLVGSIVRTLFDNFSQL